MPYMTYFYLEALKDGNWLFPQASHSPSNSCSTALEPRRCLARALHPNGSDDFTGSPTGNYQQDQRCKGTEHDQDTAMTCVTFRSSELLLHSRPALNTSSLPDPPSPQDHKWFGYWLTPKAYHSLRACGFGAGLTALDNNSLKSV